MKRRFFVIGCLYSSLSGMDSAPNTVPSRHLSRSTVLQDSSQEIRFASEVRIKYSQNSSVSTEQEILGLCGSRKPRQIDPNLQIFSARDYQPSLFERLLLFLGCCKPEIDEPERELLMSDRLDEAAQNTLLLSLPDEIWVEIMNYLGPTKNLAAWAQTCKQARELSMPIFAQQYNWKKQRQMRRIGSFDDFPSGATVLKIDPDGTVVAGSKKGDISVWRHNGLIKFYKGDGSRINDLVSNHTIIFSCSDNRGLGRWDTANNKFQFLDTHLGIQLACALSGNGKVLVSGGLNNGELALRNPLTGEFLRSSKIPGNVESVNKIKIDYEGKRVVVVYGKRFDKETPFDGLRLMVVPDRIVNYSQQLLIGDLGTGTWRVLHQHAGTECVFHDDFYIKQSYRVIDWYQCSRGHPFYHITKLKTGLEFAKEGTLTTIFESKCSGKNNKTSFRTFCALTEDGKGLVVYQPARLGSIYYFYCFCQKSGVFKQVDSFRPYLLNDSQIFDLRPDGKWIVVSNGATISIWQRCGKDDV